jgi:Holliday junction resolvase
MVNPRQKGASCEIVVRDLLIQRTGLPFERVPGSGAGAIKGDLHIPRAKDRFCIEIKHYADSHFNDKIFTSKTNNIVVWWKKLVTQAASNNKEPILIWKYNRSKFYVCTAIKPVNTDNYVDIRWLGCYTLLLDEWLGKETIKWLK